MAPVYSLPEIPDLAVKVVQKFSGQSFVRSMRTCKWIKRLTETKRNTYIKDAEKAIISISAKDTNTKNFAEICKIIEARQYFKIGTIQLKDFRDKNDFLLNKLLPVLQQNKIYFDGIHLMDTNFIQEFFDVFNPKNYFCEDRNIKPPIEIPDGLDSIKFTIWYDKPSLVDELCRSVVGRSRKLVINCRFQVQGETTSKFMRAMADHGRNQKIKFILVYGTSSEKMKSGLRTYSSELQRFDYEVKESRGTYHHYHVLPIYQGLVIAADTPYPVDQYRELNCMLIRSAAELEAQLDTLFPSVKPSYKPNLINSLRLHLR